MYLFLPGIQNLLWDILDRNNIEFANDEKWAFSRTSIFSCSCSAVCDRDMFHLNTSSLKTVTSPLLILHAEDDNIVPHHMGLKVVSILFHFLLRVASSSFSISFPSPAVPDITSSQEKYRDRCPGWTDLLQREAWFLPQRHLLGSQSVRRGWVSFVRSEPTLRNAHATRIRPKHLHVDVPDSCRP